MHLFFIIIFSLVQGLAELLPISSSAHVILVEKLLGLNPTSPEMTFLLVMLHTGTMFAVLTYFWPRWEKILSKENKYRGDFIKMVIITTVATGILGLGIQKLIEKVFLKGTKNAAIENIFGNNWIIGIALGAVGILIIISGLLKSHGRKMLDPGKMSDSPVKDSLIIGIVQGLALPFRGFSRSGSTISLALLCGMTYDNAEVFSFSLSIILTPAVILREFLRLHSASGYIIKASFFHGVLGMIFSFFAGLIAIKWLTAWLEKGRWWMFGIYCLIFSSAILVLTGLKILV